MEERKNLFDLNQKTAIVTGGSIGLGFNIASGLAEAGANIAIAARRFNLCREAAKKIEELGVKCLPIKVDITNKEDIKKMVEITLEKLKRIDILVNNAGIGINHKISIDKIEEWDKVFKTNITGCFLCSAEVGKRMIEQKKGRIINISSIYGFLGTNYRLYDLKPEDSLISYSASKGAVINFTRDLAMKWAKYNININCISPGMFLSDQSKRFINKELKKRIVNNIPLGKFGDKDDLKGAAIFLSSDASNYITGQNIIVDGGWSIW